MRELMMDNLEVPNWDRQNDIQTPEKMTNAWARS